MSRTLKLTAVSVFGIILGAATMWLFQSKQEKLQRKAASVDTGKLKFLNGKNLTNIQVRLALPENLPNEDDKDVTLTALVYVSNERSETLEYEWELPNGVEVVQGHVSDSLPGIKQGQTARVDLVVRGFSSQNLKLVTFKAYYQSNEGQFGNSAILSSRPQDSFEFIAPTAVEASGINPRPRIQK